MRLLNYFSLIRCQSCRLVLKIKWALLVNLGSQDQVFELSLSVRYQLSTLIRSQHTRLRMLFPWRLVEPSLPIDALSIHGWCILIDGGYTPLHCHDSRSILVRDISLSRVWCFGSSCKEGKLFRLQTISSSASYLCRLVSW